MDLLDTCRQAYESANLRVFTIAGKNPHVRRTLRLLSRRPLPLTATWETLHDELQCWREIGRSAEFWWRDDDATALSPRLQRLLTLRRNYSIALGLAVIPAQVTTELAHFLSSEDDVFVMQHGWQHTNYARPGLPMQELDAGRPVVAVLADLMRGHSVLDDMFEDAWLRVVVPPYHAISHAVAAALPDAGYLGLSTFGFRKARVTGLTEVNTHVDIIDWTTNGAADEKYVLGRAVAHLRAKRMGLMDPDEPTGLLSHHLEHDDAAWRMLEMILARLSAHPAVRFTHPQRIFAERKVSATKERVVS